MEKIKVITWNIRGSASLGWNNSHQIESKVVDKIIEQGADIIVLTEFVIVKGVDYLFERLKNEGYIWFISSQTGKNGILIGVKRVLIREKELIDQIYKNNMITAIHEGCNVLKVELPMRDDENLVVVGCRMEVGGKLEKDMYDRVGKCFNEILIPVIKPLNENYKYIVCGDFNNGRCLGALNEKYSEDDYLNEDGTPKVHIDYNLNIIKDTFNDIDFTMVDINAGNKPIATYTSKNGWRFPLDHIFVRGFSCEKCETISPVGLSDHDILMAEVKM